MSATNEYPMRLVQFVLTDGQRRVGIVQDDEVHELGAVNTMQELAMRAIERGTRLAEQARAHKIAATHDYATLLDERRILVPLDHADPAHCLVSGTGLTHLGSADARAKMHATPAEQMTDSMRMFQWGIEGGRPAPGQAGVQPEWFYKGDGGIVVHPGQELPVPAFAMDAGEECEIVGLYVIGPQGQPFRLGFAIGNEFSDHVMERRNYLYLAHSKLRACSFGPELLTGPLPQQLQGTGRIRRDAAVLWERSFASGEANMSHTLANLEHHHFKYSQFRRPGDVHVHFFGTSILSFSDGVTAREGDVFEIGVEGFGRPLVNRLGARGQAPALSTVTSL